MRDFSAPPATYAPQLAWLWNGDLREDTLRQQLRSLAAAGFGGATLRAARGHTTVYLGEEWLQLVRACAAECQESRLTLWLGDDSGPSGSCVARITNQRSDLLAHYLKFAVQDVAEADTAQWSPAPVAGQLLYALAVPLIGTPPRPDLARAVTLTNIAPERATVLVGRLAADVRVFTFSEEVDGYVDILNPETSQLFIESTHERYRAALGETFGTTVAGFSACYPTLWDPSEEGDAHRFPWSPHLRDFFARHCGYDLLEWLPALIAEFGDDASRFRQEFWQAIIAMAQESFWQPLGTWAGQNGVQYSGYPRGEEPLNAMVAQQGDVAPVYGALQQPGVSAPQLAASRHTLSLGRGLQARLCASIAALQGKPRTMAETWSGTDWSATLQDRIVSLHHLMRQGITSFVPHAGLYTLRGRRQRDDSPSELHQPYWPQWKPFADYITRSCYALAQGKPGARVGLLWPARSGWCHHHPRGHRLTRWVEEDLYATALLLDEINFEFLLLPEDDLIAAPCEETRLLCGPAQIPLEMIVLPSVTALSWAAWRKLEAFVACGGKVACLGLLPRWSERGRDRELEEHIGKTLSVTIADFYESYAIMENRGQAPTTVGYPITREDTSGGRWNSYQPRLNTDIKDAFLRVRKLLKESLAPELETQATEILYTRRILEEVPEAEAVGEVLVKTEPDAPLGGLSGLADRLTAAQEQAALEPEPALREDLFDWDKPFDWDAEEPAGGPQDTSGTADTTLGSPGAGPSVEQDRDAPAPGADSEDDLLPAESVVVEEADLRNREYLNSGGDLFFIFNACGEAQHVNLRLRPSRDGAPHRLDAWSGEIRKLPVWMPFSPDEGGGLSLTLELAAQEAQLIWIRPFANPQAPRFDNIERATFRVESFDGRVASGYATESGVHRIAVRQGEKIGRYSTEPVTVPGPIMFDDTWTAVRRGPNVLLLNDWQWQHGRNELGTHRWFGGEKWRPVPSREAAPQTAPSLDQRPQMDFSGIVTFLTDFQVAESPHSLYLQFDPLDVAYKLYLNGEPLDPCAPPYPAEPQWADPEWQWFDLSIAEIGKNTLACLVDYRERKPLPHSEYKPDLLPELPRLIGDFSLTDQMVIKATEPMLLADGSWHDQGLPFYSGAVEYRQWVTIPAEWSGCRVFLEMSHMRDVAAVWMNGRACGVQMAEPYRFDVTRRVLKGAANEVRLRVWNTAEAALAGHIHTPQPSGMLGPVRLAAYPIVYPIVEAKA